MSPEQIEDLLIEWSIYSAKQQDDIKAKYLLKYGPDCGKAHWLNYLKDRLEMGDYWKKINLK